MGHRDEERAEHPGWAENAPVAGGIETALTQLDEELTAEWTTCPDPGCGALADVRYSSVSDQDGVVEVAKVWCAGSHWFLLPSELLLPPAQAPPPARRGRRAAVNPQPDRGT